MDPLSIITTRSTVASGEPTSPLARGVRDGSLIRVRPGAYVDAVDWGAARWRERQLTRIVLVQRAARSPLTFSHSSAAALLGIPVLGRQDEAVHVTGAPDGGRRTRNGVIRHETVLAADELTTARGMVVTTAWRTALDLAATQGMRAGVVALDHVLHDLDDRESALELLRASVDARRPFRGVRRVDAALGIATGLADTPIESLSLACFAQHGIPRPLQQYRLVVPGRGTYFGDFYWPEWDLLGEADGRRKYEKDAERDGRDPRDVLWAEKVREDAIRSRVRRFARWTWADAVDGHALARIIRRAASS